MDEHQRQSVGHPEGDCTDAIAVTNVPVGPASEATVFSTATLSLVVFCTAFFSRVCPLTALAAGAAAAGAAGAAALAAGAAAAGAAAAGAAALAAAAGAAGAAAASSSELLQATMDMTSTATEAAETSHLIFLFIISIFLLNFRSALNSDS